MAKKNDKEAAEKPAEDPKAKGATPEGEGPAEGEEQPKKDRTVLKLAGGVVALIALGGILAFMALPSKPEPAPRMTGPLHHTLFASQYVSNVEDNHFTRFIKTNPQIEYFAYDKTYLDQRAADPLYLPWLEHAFGGLLSSSALEEVYSGTMRERFAEQIREEIDPILFPVHVGETKAPLDAEPESGLRLGNSYRHATFRGRFHDHHLKVDALAHTLQLDDGPVVTFTGDEEDLAVRDAAGAVIYLDTTGVQDTFQGELTVGVHGRVRQVFLSQHLAQ